MLSAPQLNGPHVVAHASDASAPRTLNEIMSRRSAAAAAAELAMTPTGVVSGEC